MGQIAKLTDLGGSFGLPVVDVFIDSVGVFLPNWPNAKGSQQTKQIWKMWSDADLNTVGYARFSEVPVSDPDRVSTGTSDALNTGKVVRTHTSSFKTKLALKDIKKAAILERRRAVAAGGIVFATKNFATDAPAMNDINLIFNALNAGESFLGNSIPWDTTDGEVLNATEAQFLSFSKAVAQHRIKATIAARAHITAVDALTTAQAIADYDITADIAGSEWPVNP